MTFPLQAITTSVIEEHTGTITADDLRAAFGIPLNAVISVSVPGGGDWSHTQLDIKDHPLEVRWTTVHAL